MEVSQKHPSPQQLLEFADGHLQAPDFAAIEEHLNSCETCCQWISRQSDDALLTLAREVATVGLRTSSTLEAPDLGEIPAALLDHPRYRVMEQIGIGGMGAVYKAEHRLMQRTVALKIVHPWLLSDSQAVGRFKREVRVAARLAHPNVVVSYDADQADNLHFLVMEHVAGETLSDKIAREGPASVAQACDWIRQAALGLQHAHEQGMAHRDIKPHNLMVTNEGQVRILDFGLSRLVSDQVSHKSETSDGRSRTSHTHAGTILGTPDYIAPEQITKSSDADIRADIYSLGCTLYFLLTGRPPFVGGAVVETLHAHQKAPFPSLSQTRVDAPPPLLDILARMTAKRPEDRYATPGEVALALAKLSAGGLEPDAVSADALTPSIRVVTASPGVVPRASGLRARRSRSVTLGMAAVVAGGLLLFGLAASGYLAPTLFKKPPARMLVALPSKGLWFPDYQGLIDAAQATNVQLTFASAANAPSELVESSPPGVAIPDLPLDSSLKADDYAAIIFVGYDTSEFATGGAAASDTRRLVNEFQMQKKVLASLCTGQRVLAQHGALRGKRVARCEYVRGDEIDVAGGEQTDLAIETHGLVVTAENVRNAPEFLRAILKAIPR